MTVDINILIAIAGVIIGILGFTLNRDNTKKVDIEESTAIKVTLEHIKNTLEEIKKENASFRFDMVQKSGEIVRIQEVQKSNNKRIEKLEFEVKELKEMIVK